MYPPAVAEAVRAWGEGANGLDMLLAAVVIGVVIWAAASAARERDDEA